MLLIRLLTALCIAVLIAPSVAACPFCDSSTAAQVRAGIFNADFNYHVVVSLAPFFILIAMLIFIYYWPTSGQLSRSRSELTRLESRPSAVSKP